MKVNIILFLVVILMFGLWAHGLQAAFGLGGKIDSLDIKNGPVVVELFTSQSCSSCPSADKVLRTLSEHQDVIALGCHVTYWNHLHWKDTLSKDSCTYRQHGYASYKNSGRVYTPQMIVNGAREFVGSRAGVAVKAINNAGAIERIALSYDQGKLDVSLPALERGSYKITIFGTKKTHTEDIPSGENRGKSLTYSNSVLLLQDGGLWAGKVENKAFTIPSNQAFDHLVVLVQGKDFGPIYAAGKLEL